MDAVVQQFKPKNISRINPRINPRSYTMRPIRRSIFELWPEESNRLPSIVNKFRDKYRVLGNNLDRFPVILDLIAKDLSVLSEERTGRGRNAVLTVENIFRAIVVKQMEGFTYRQTCQESGNNIVSDCRETKSMCSTPFGIKECRTAPLSSDVKTGI